MTKKVEIIGRKTKINRKNNKNEKNICKSTRSLKNIAINSV